MSIMLLALITITGCSERTVSSLPSERISYQRATAVNAEIPQKSDIEQYTLFIRQNDFPLEKYEPTQKCWIGADITLDKTVNGDISMFEEKMSYEHDLYANSMKLGDSYPFAWILECIGASKTPVLEILPQNQDSPYDKDLLIKTAKDAGELNIPIFIKLYPFCKEVGYNKNEYISFFKKASDTFRQHAPNVAIIWSVCSDDAFDSSYYPGDEYVDWVGIDIKQDISQSDDNNVFNPVNKNLEYFYLSFQKQKPIMITSLSISHYSTLNMKYYITEAASEINKIYKAIAEKHPRIKGIIYKSYNEIDFREPDAERAKKTYNNFLLAEDDGIKEAYADAVSKDRFSSPDSNEMADTEIISPFPAYRDRAAYFISEKSLRYDIEVVGLDLLKGNELYINGSKYYDLETLKQHLTLDYEIDDDMQTFTIVK